jgi:hypothetical protein
VGEKMMTVQLVCFIAGALAGAPLGYYLRHLQSRRRRRYYV